MDGLIKLNVVGLGTSPNHQGAISLLLAQEDGPYVLRLIIGPAEAQAINIILQGYKLPRPLIQNLFENFAHAFGIVLQSVYIYKVEDGIYFSEMRFTDGNREVVLDCRTSDAIAVALCTKAPIYTNAELLLNNGYIITNKDYQDEHGNHGYSLERNVNVESNCLPLPKYENMSVDELTKTMQQCIEREEYEKAAEIKRIIEQKKNK